MRKKRCATVSHDKGEGPVSVCSCCGFPLKQNEIFSLFQGEMQVREKNNPDTVNQYKMNMHFCSECTRKLVHYTLIDVEEAEKKLRRLENV